MQEEHQQLCPQKFLFVEFKVATVDIKAVTDLILWLLLRENGPKWLPFCVLLKLADVNRPNTPVAHFPNEKQIENKPKKNELK